MHETSNIDCPSSATGGWRSVYIGSPRRSGGPAYAMILKRGDGEEIIARNVTLAQALVIALEHGGGYGAVMVYRDRGAFRDYAIGPRPLCGGAFAGVLTMSVPRTRGLATDHARAMEAFEEIMEHDARMFWNGRIESAGDRAVRRANIIGDAT
jgi:hypothetical protein